MNQKKVINEILNRLEKLEDVVFKSDQVNKSKKTSTVQSNFDGTKLNFDINERAFIKKYAKKMSGPKKFTLLVAFNSKGDEKVDAQLGEIETMWNRMKSLLRGKFNRFYPNAAKTNGWVDSEKKSLYHLSNNWKEIFT